MKRILAAMALAFLAASTLSVEAGFYFTRTRVLNAKDGIWLSRDPIGERGGINLYAYCENDPINLVDPTGEQGRLNDPLNRRTFDPSGGGGGTPPSAGGGSSGGAFTCPANSGLENRGFSPPPGTRVPPPGIPNNWRVGGTDTPGGVRYTDPLNPGNRVRVMPGDPSSQYPNSQNPYVRWQQNGRPLDVNGNPLPSAETPDAHIPLQNFQFAPDLF